MWTLAGFGIDELETCGATLRTLGEGADSMEEVAGRIVRCLHEGLVDEGRRSSALVRFYKTHRYGSLEPELQAFAAASVSADDLAPTTPCLTLLATAGTEPAWCDRRLSAAHRAIPLESHEAVRRLPMVARLFDGLGMALDDVLADAPPRDVLQLHQRSYDVFFVPQAAGSEWVPAQDTFVVPHGIRSVLGIGGVLPSGDVFAVVLFTVVPVSDETADLFRSLAPAVKASVVPVTYRVFA